MDTPAQQVLVRWYGVYLRENETLRHQIVRLTGKDTWSGLTTLSAKYGLGCLSITANDALVYAVYPSVFHPKFFLFGGSPVNVGQTMTHYAGMRDPDMMEAVTAALRDFRAEVMKDSRVESSTVGVWDQVMHGR